MRISHSEAEQLFKDHADGDKHVMIPLQDASKSFVKMKTMGYNEYSLTESS